MNRKNQVNHNVIRNQANHKDNNNPPNHKEAVNHKEVAKTILPVQVMPAKIKAVKSNFKKALVMKFPSSPKENREHRFSIFLRAMTYNQCDLNEYDNVKFF